MRINAKVEKSSLVQQNENYNQGIWKSFFHLCLYAKLPIVLILVYCAVAMGSSKLMLLIPDKTGQLFAGNVSSKLVFTVIALQITGSLISQVVILILQIVNAKIDRNFRNVLWKKLLSLKPAFFDRIPAVSLISRITGDTQNLRSFIMDIIIQELINIYTFYITLSKISQYDKSLMYILLVFIPISFLIAFFFGRLFMRVSIKVRDNVSNLTGFLSELINCIPLIKSFNKEKYESKRGNAVIDDLYKANRSQVYVDLLRSPINTAVSLSQQVILVLVGIPFLKSGKLDVAGWYAFYMYAITLLTEIMGKSQKWQDIKAVQGSVYRISKVLEEPAEGIESYEKEVMESGDIIIDKVTFGYDKTDIFKEISFTIPEKKTTAIVGGSGAGKTTILKLIERFYQPRGGRILFHGKSIDEYDIKSWRANIAYVCQEVSMMSGTIRENMVYGVKRDVSEQELMEAAKLANAYDFIQKQPKGFDTQVGQFGCRLSGGQRQRICIARAFLHNSKYLVLDEPTSNLDVVSAAEVVKGIENLKRGRTVLVVAHDTKAVMNADNIIVFNDDGSVSSGSHNELLICNSFYRSMVKRQRGGIKDE
ncbi:ABC transporter ATP-binding protein [Clostridium sp. P21]|uniref:ABC transporter ATP-binding protein n=1 Tax=Clostridium muellerianum TaxID=2716538 RepID=A0A7Y0HMI9_9CLOT|nr:ABC transporter ATP-binding protein [Clostridium muellerianum]NMM63014.1 ABC transporter ATP-binding protein [Clostridium muellerianum]